jgi:glycosyltransferase involved in cell wall biosynthesis
MKTGKYDIIFITGKPYYKEYSYDKRIKRYVGEDNFTIIKNITKHENIDFFILQNFLGPKTINFYKSLGKKVIGMFHGVYMSAMFHNEPLDYRNWLNFDLFDSFIFIAADDYYFYKNLGFENEIYIPNLYTFEPKEIKESNLTSHNILMLGRLNDEIKGLKYAVKALYYIVKEVHDAKLTLVTSDYRIEFAQKLAKDLNISYNLVVNYHTYNISQHFWNSAVHMYTSLTEAFPMAMNEAKAHGLPIVAFDVPFSPPYQDGVITVDLLDCKGLARETIKLFKDYNYRKKMGKVSKLSLNQFSNEEIVEMWEKLFKSLLSENKKDYREFQKEIENKYYNEKTAKKHIQKHFDALLRYNKNFTCYTLDNFLDPDFIKNIKECTPNKNL